MGPEQSTEDFFNFIEGRRKELIGQGIPQSEASSIALLEERISRWPENWGENLEILLYGDFSYPESTINLESLGIIIEPGHLPNTIIASATHVVKARVSVTEKTIAGLTEAAGRIDILLGALSVADWGNCGSGWWCHLTHGSLAGIEGSINESKIEAISQGLRRLQPCVKKKVQAALYWIQEPKRMLREGFRSDILHVYAGYWNAFELLVEAVCLARPRPTVSKAEKQQELERFIEEKKIELSNMKLENIADCYNSVVNKGFNDKAKYALEICFPDNYNKYIIECFKTTPKRNRLYDIRNAINHGDIDASDFLELIRIEGKRQRLWMIVFGMLGRFIPIDRPVDAEVEDILGNAR